MLGNVMEWTADWYDRDYYEEAPERNPRGPADGDFKTLRGGSWLTPLDGLGNTRRSYFDPLVTQANLGFRCASDIP
ncbi:MAG: SUMF1/EgtB/PvdO family nonheme iron enzyme, partial [Anaerolineales bacterium]|nr:SUMF1/EgtB/PvdO family nonheme iron enzyme [Anaerolineales bacterium]